MTLLPTQLPQLWLWIACALYGGLCAFAAAGINYRRFVCQPLRQHLFFAASIMTMVLWFMRTGEHPGLYMHILGVTGLTLVLGWRMALVGSLFAVLGSAVLGLEPWPSVGVAGLLLAAFPIFLTQGIIRLADRRLPPSTFAYVFVCAFCGSVLAAGLARMAVAGLLWWSGAYPPEQLMEDYLRLLPFVLLPEGLINGLFVSALAAYRPRWLTTLNPRHYQDHP